MNDSSFCDEMFDKMIELAMRRKMAMDGEEFDSISADEHYIFSPMFEKKMKKLIRVRPSISGMKIFKTTVASLLILMSVSFVGLMSVDAVRAEVLKVILDWKGKYVDVIFMGTSSRSTDIILEEDVKYPEYLPDGYRLNADARIFSPGMSLQVYADFAGDQIIIRQMLADSPGSQSHNSEEVVPEDIDINGFKAVIISGKDRNKGAAIIWSDGKFSFTVNGNIDKYELLSVAKSLK